MTKHDKIRQILYENDFKFDDGRTALDMTDEEVEKFVVVFVARMGDLSRQMTKAMQNLSVLIVQAVEPMRNLGELLAEIEQQ